MLTKLFSFFALFGVALTAICPGTALTDAERNYIVDQHNKYRSQLARGESVIYGGKKAPSAKNMYQLDYDCELEKTAEAGAKNCWPLPDKLCNIGENNMFSQDYTSRSEAQKQADLSTVIFLWWNDVTRFDGITPTNVSLTDTIEENVNFWKKMAWAKTTLIGCARHLCGNEMGTFCHYKNAEYVIGQNIYEIGTPCSSDIECTTYPNSKCNTTSKLCFTDKESVKNQGPNDCSATTTHSSTTIQTTTVSSTTVTTTSTSTTSTLSTSPTTTIATTTTTTTKTTPPKNNECNKTGYQLISSATNTFLSPKGKFGGYFQHRETCEELCNQNYGLLKCIGYMYEPKNRGKCTIFQYPFEEKIIEDPNSIASVFKKCG